MVTSSGVTFLMLLVFLEKSFFSLPLPGLGTSQSMGHIDFYPNGGEKMPGCSANRGRPSDLDAMWLGEEGEHLTSDLLSPENENK